MPSAAPDRRSGREREMAMATSGDTPIPGDIIREGLTNDQVEFLKRNFAQEASHQGLIATFQATSQPDGLMTLVVHFARQGNISTSPPPGQRVAPSAPGGTNPPAPGQSTTPAEQQKVARFRPMLDFIAQHEGTADKKDDGYNTSFGFGMFIVGGEKTLVGMTLLQIDELQTQILNNPKNHFQFVRDRPISNCAQDAPKPKATIRTLTNSLV